MIRGRFTYPFVGPSPEHIDRLVLRRIRRVRKPFDRPLPSLAFKSCLQGKTRKVLRQLRDRGEPE